MKILLIFPPLWDFNLAPMLSLPLLSGMLKEQGHEVEIMDLNSQFINFLSNDDFVDYCENYGKFINAEYAKIKEHTSNSEQDTLLKNCEKNMNFLENIRKCEIYNFLKICPHTKDAISEVFTERSPAIFDRLMSKLKFDVYGIFNESLKCCDNYEKSFFYSWEQQIIERINKFNPELIAFSIYFDLQLNWTLNFVKELKKQCNAKIMLGGTQITQLRNGLPEDIFDNIDIINYGEGETAFSQIAKGTPLESVPNIIFKDKTGVIVTENLKNSAEFKFYKPNYKGIDFKQYLLPKTVIPIESSRGCYWNKCIYCTFMDCSTYKVKNIDDLIEEIKEYVNVYNIHHFFFTDSAIHPKYAREFSEKLRENNLKIYYLTFLRLEKEFDDELLKLMYDTGLRVAMWGIESGSDRILTLYKKGTTAQSNAKILNSAHKAGIYNYCCFMSDFPKETKEDIDYTKEFLFQNYDNIDYITCHHFTLMPTSPLEKMKKEFDLEKYSFKRMEGYVSTPELNDYTSVSINKIFDLYRGKLNQYPSDLSFLLLKISEERP